MRGRIEVFLHLFDSILNRPVTSLFTQAFQTGKNTVGEQGLFVLHSSDLFVLRILPLDPADYRHNGGPNNDERADHAGESYDNRAVGHFTSLLSDKYFINASAPWWRGARVDL